MSMAYLDGAARLESGNGDAQSDWFKLSGGYKFGKRPIGTSSEHDLWNFMSHDDGGVPAWNTEAAAVGKGVKFGSGFQRRRGAAIGQDAERKAFEEGKEERQRAVAEVRKVALESADKRNRFNVLSGEFDPSMDRGSRPGRRIIGSSLSAMQQKEDEVRMRVSDSRFHRPPADVPSEAAARRTAVLMNEGFTHSTRQSAVLGVGRGDMRSYGVADAFTHSLYDPGHRLPSPPSAPPASAFPSAPSSTLARIASASSLPPMPASASSSSSRDRVVVVAKPPHDPALGRDASGSMFVPPQQQQRPPSNVSSIASRTLQLRESRASSRRSADVNAVRALD